MSIYMGVERHVLRTRSLSSERYLGFEDLQTVVTQEQRYCPGPP